MFGTNEINKFVSDWNVSPKDGSLENRQVFQMQDRGVSSIAVKNISANTMNNTYFKYKTIITLTNENDGSKAIYCDFSKMFSQLTNCSEPTQIPGLVSNVRFVHDIALNNAENTAYLPVMINQSDSAIYQCRVDNNANLTSCKDVPVDLPDGAKYLRNVYTKKLKNGNEYAYFTGNLSKPDMLGKDIFRCRINTDGELTECTDQQLPIDNSIENTGIDISQVTISETGSFTYLLFTSYNYDLYTCILDPNTRFPDTTDFSEPCQRNEYFAIEKAPNVEISINDEHNKLYATQALSSPMNSGNLYTCDVDSNRIVTNCTYTYEHEDNLIDKLVPYTFNLA